MSRVEPRSEVCIPEVASTRPSSSSWDWRRVQVPSLQHEPAPTRSSAIRSRPRRLDKVPCVEPHVESCIPEVASTRPSSSARNRRRVQVSSLQHELASTRPPEICSRSRRLDEMSRIEPRSEGCISEEASPTRAPFRSWDWRRVQVSSLQHEFASTRPPEVCSRSRRLDEMSRIEPFVGVAECSQSSVRPCIDPTKPSQLISIVAYFVPLL